MVNQYVPLQVNEGCDPVVADEQSLELLNLAKKVAKTEASVMVLRAKWLR